MAFQFSHYNTLWTFRLVLGIFFIEEFVANSGFIFLEIGFFYFCFSGLYT